MKFSIENHGSIILVRPHTPVVSEWLTENCPDAMWFGRALVCEPRYVEPLVEGMVAEGFMLQPA